MPKSGTFVTASTGIAACNVGGTTIHQFGGMGRGEGAAETIAKSIDRRDAGNRWRFAKTLIVDEISMVCGETFDKLNAVAKILRKNKKPFGGMRKLSHSPGGGLKPIRATYRSCLFLARRANRVG